MDGRKRKNPNSESIKSDEFRNANQTPSYVLQPNAFFSDPSAAPVRSAPPDGPVFLSNRVSADGTAPAEPAPVLFGDDL